MSLPGLGAAAIGFFGEASLSPATSAYTANGHVTGSGTSQTISGVSIGTAAAGRIVCIGVAGNKIPSVITIGGVVATIVPGGDAFCVAIAVVPSGTTATIVLTYSASGSHYTAYGVWAVYGAAGYTSVFYGGAAGTGSGSITIPAGGVAISFTVTTAMTSGISCAWAGATEDFDAAAPINAFPQIMLLRSGARKSATAEETLTISATATPTGTMALAILALR